MISRSLQERRFPFRSESAVQRAQCRNVLAAVRHARTHVPYYRETMRRLLLDGADFRTPADLDRLPIIERDEVQRDPEYFLSDLWPPQACLAQHSAGTTGEPVTVFRDPPSLLVEAAVRERLRPLILRSAGRRIRYREALIVPLDSSVKSAVDAVRRSSLLSPSIRTERQTFSMLRPPEELLLELERFRPDVISTYGSYLEALVVSMRSLGHRGWSPMVAGYGGDSFSAEVRAWASAELGIEVFSSYNAIEAAPIGFECEHHRGYHLNIDLFPLHLIGADGNRAAEGQVIVSNLLNRATVLLNYRLGDVAAWLPDACRCGRTLPLCSYLERTKAAWLALPDGRSVHAQALRLLLRHETEVWRYQIVQERRDRCLLRLVVRPGSDRDALRERVIAGFREALGAGVEVATEFVDQLPAGPAGKVQPVVALSR